MAFGGWVVVQRAGAIHPAEFGAWFVALILVHDLVVAPILSALAAWIGPRVSPVARGAVIAAAIASGALVLLSLPPLLGNPAGNETLLPRNYAAGIAVALGVVWVVAGGAVAVGMYRTGRRP
jgi:phosphatidylglycerophosphate synthase